MMIRTIQYNTACMEVCETSTWCRKCSTSVL